ncbi:uncharacterized protein LOC111397708 [Olea europaea var. sylvestris]|uniref:Uncharacterized protein n=1 Tax=Olea europaea subsp. europaea TaxID=158383 RepID=A0A8S0PW16_OLEEU|nr:uncharacterized protein LOC111397708 [Olea europaea var. sylvestris]CAA2958792.1 Hypothetical predicted protein [Olea europaea subsp. europaea]
MASSSTTSFCSATLPYKKPRFHRFLQVRSQSYGEEGKSRDIVDVNLCILRERIQEIRVKERLENCCVAKQGWNYAHAYNYKRKIDAQFSLFLQIIGIVCGTFSLVLACCTLCLCLFSLLVHLH